MPEPYPVLMPVRGRGAGATHTGPRRAHNEDAFASFDDATAASALVAEHPGDNLTAVVVEIL